jgi:prevent-host-death family protein
MTFLLNSTMNLAMSMSMSKAANIADLKNHLSGHLESVEQGEEVVICRRNIPFARITPMPLRPNRTKLGFDRGRIKIRGDITGPAVPESDWNALRDDHDLLK